MQDTERSSIGDGSLLPGHRLGAYEVREELGRGAMGIVYRGYDTQLEREVAIKVLSSPASSFAQRLLREARIMARTEHPNILAVHAAGQQGGLLYLVMHLVRGEDLGQRLAREGALSLDEALRITRETALALQAASAAGIVHRDIKPDNILLDADGHVKVSDFGLSRELNTANVSLTCSSDYVGTPRYSSPEQWMNLDLDVRSDIYSLGVVLYEMLAGKPPFDAPSLGALMQQILQGEPLQPDHDVADLPPGVSDLLHRMIARDRDERFSSAAEVVQAIDALEVTGGPPGKKPVALKPGERHVLGPVQTEKRDVQHTGEESVVPRPVPDARGARSGEASGGLSYRLLGAAAVLMVFATLWALRPAPIPAPLPAPSGPMSRVELPVYVLDFGSSEPQGQRLEWLRVAGPDLVMGALVRQKWLRVVPRERVEMARRANSTRPEDAAGMAEAAKSAGATILVSCGYNVVATRTPPARVLLTVRLVNLEAGRDEDVWTIQSTDDPDTMLDSLKALSRDVSERLAPVYSRMHDGKAPALAAAQTLAWQAPGEPSENEADAVLGSKPAAESAAHPRDVDDGNKSVVPAAPPRQGGRAPAPAPRQGSAAPPSVQSSVPAGPPQQSGAVPSGGGRANPATRPARGPSPDEKRQALELYGRGQEMLADTTRPDRVEKASACFEQALKLCPGFGSAREALERAKSLSGPTT